MAAWEHLSESNEHFTPLYILGAAATVLGGRIDLDPASSVAANKRVCAARFYTELDQGLARDWFCETMFLNPPGGLSDDQGRRVIRKKGSVPACTVTGACGLPAGHVHEGVESSAKRWWFRLASEHEAGNVKRAIFVGFSLEMLQTMQVDTPWSHDKGVLLAGGATLPRTLPTPLDFPLCFPRSRIAYDKFENGVVTKGASPPHASFIAYLGRSEDDEQRFRDVFSSLGKVVG